VLSMTVAAGVLRILEPGAVPPLGGVTLLSIESDAAERPEDKLDGRTEVGYRWKYQEPGDYLVGPNAGWYHQQAIGVCVVGDADNGEFTPSQQRELIWLVRQLQQAFSIPPEYVFVDVGAGDAPAPGFSEGHFRQSLLGVGSQTAGLR